MWFIPTGECQVLFRFPCSGTTTLTDAEQYQFRQRSYSSCKLGVLCHNQLRSLGRETIVQLQVLEQKFLWSHGSHERKLK